MPSFQKILRKPASGIIVLAFLQLLCATYFLQVEGFNEINRLLFLFCGFGISLLLLKQPSFSIANKMLLSKQSIVKITVLLLLLPISYYFCQQIMDATPLEKEYADMLPIMKVMGKRFIDGHPNRVYDPITEIWNGIQPVYLPAMWIPFISSIIFHFDMRWVTVSGIWLSVLICVLPFNFKKNILQVLFISGLLILLVWLHFEKTNNVIRLSEEGVVFFYYSLMVVAIISGKPWLVGGCAALCLLSRYAIIGWIPFAGIYLLHKKQYAYFFKAFISGTAILLVLLLPFGIKPLFINFSLPAEYIHQAEKVWKENPEFFNKSLGMAKFFGAEHIVLLHSILLAGTFIIPFLFLLLIKRKNISPSVALLSCFQLCITFFYNFLDVSYLYLYYTPVFISLAIAGWLSAMKPEK